MQANFQHCLEIILGFEGGWWAGNAADPNPTMHGVTLATFQHYYPGSTAADLRNITPEQETLIYADGFWLPVRADALPDGVDLMTFDESVQRGVYNASKTLQTAVGVLADGIIGPATLAAVGAYPAPTLINEISAARRAHYLASPNFPTFGVGWLGRLAQCTALALGMTRQAVV